MKIAGASWPVNRGYAGLKQGLQRGYTGSMDLFNPCLTPVYPLLNSQAAVIAIYPARPPSQTRSGGRGREQLFPNAWWFSHSCLGV